MKGLYSVLPVFRIPSGNFLVAQTKARSRRQSTGLHCSNGSYVAGIYNNNKPFQYWHIHTSN